MNKRLLGLCRAIIAALGITLYSWLSQPLAQSKLGQYSYKLYSEDGEPLASRTSLDGYWRLPANLKDIDPKLIKFLVAYEDKRYWDHLGVDVLALSRALRDWMTSGEVKSGASTLTMQTARLLYPELSKKTILAKLQQMAMAIKLEYHWSKEQILEAYFSLAPYGGNIEGIVAGSEAWLSRSPLYLTDREAALFVALPQSPEARRPDRHPSIAERSTTRVLETIAIELSFSADRLGDAVSEQLPLRVGSLSYGDQHLIDRLMSSKSGEHTTTIAYQWQSVARSILQSHLSNYPDPVNGAVMVVERRSGNVKVYVGSEGYHNDLRKGAINYLTVPRSPGSTLKPLIYGLALNRNLLNSNSVLMDSEIQVAGYAPTNFDDGFHGSVRLRDALIQSLNIPAINTLNQLGPNAVDNQIRRYIGLPSDQSKTPGLSLAVGGLHLSAEDLANLYLGITNQPTAALNFDSENEPALKEPLISGGASRDLLSLMTQLDSSGRKYILKTGTSNGKRDAWAIYVTAGHLVLVWLGTADNQVTEDLVGIKAAAPIGQDLITNLGLNESRTEIFEGLKATSNVLVIDECPRLIQYPENGEFILITQNMLRVAGSKPEIEWYLDGERVVVKNQMLTLESEGAHQLTARSGKCISTHSIYLKSVD